MLGGLSACTIAPLRRVLNAAARVVTGLLVRDHVTDTMRTLHRLPVAYLFRCKLSLVMYAVHKNTGPSQIANVTIGITTLPRRGRLRLAKTSEVDIPRT